MSTVHGWGSALRLLWRRNRLFWVLWVVGLALLMPLTATQYDRIVPSGTDATAMLESFANNPSMTALLGPAWDLTTKGGFVFWRVGGFVSMFAGMMAAFGIIRSTRAEEEDGRLELLRAGTLGRHAPLLAAIALWAGASLAAGALSGALAAAVGLPVPGAVAAALAVATPGLAFTGLGAVAAQLFESARSARYWTVGAGWGGMFLLRMIVDGGGTDGPYAWARWALPIEWGLLLRPWVAERWWVFALPVALLAALTLLALRLESARDHGAGLRHTRLGRAGAPASLSGPWGLAWRLQRGSILGWTVALLVTAVGTGSIMSQMDQALADNPEVGQLLQRMGGTENLQVAFYLAMLGILGTVAGVMGVTFLGRLRGEENAGHTEPMLATATSRWSYAGSHLVWALAVPAVVFVAVGALMPLTQAQAAQDYAPMGDYARAAAGLLPGVVLVVGLAMALIGWAPRLAWLVWVVVGWTMFATWFAVLFDVPAWLTDVNPFGYLAHLPRDEMDWRPFAIELALGLFLVVLGLVGYRRRNIPA